MLAEEVGKVHTLSFSVIPRTSDQQRSTPGSEQVGGWEPWAPEQPQPAVAAGARARGLAGAARPAVRGSGSAAAGGPAGTRRSGCAA